MRKLALLLQILFIGSCVNAQSDQINALNGISAVTVSTQNGSSIFPGYVKFKEQEGPELKGFERWFKTNYKLVVDFGFKLINTNKDQIGLNHYRYTQTYKGIPLNGTMLIVHVKNNQVISFNGELSSEVPAQNLTTISEKVALINALKYTGAKSYKWQIPAEEAFIKREQGETASFYPTAELVYSKGSSNQFKLAYRFDIYAHLPVSRNYVFVDASSGIILSSENLIKDIDVLGSAQTAYTGTQTITTDFSNGTYRLREAGRGLGIETYNMQVGIDYAAAIDFTDSDNLWNNVNAAKDQYATDAHFAAEKTYDYFLSKYTRNSLDGAGMKILSYVHANLVGMGRASNIGAFWDGSRATIGDGGSGYTPLTATDIVAHELAHGLTSNSAKLIAYQESGALNEGFSDIFGTAIEFYATPNLADWTIAEDMGGAIRSLSNPNAYNQPDTYRGTNWYIGSDDFGGVHKNDGVLNYWFYLLTNGGSGTNDIGNVFSVSAIGIDKAAAIAFRTLTVYLFPNAQYADARFYAIKSAEDLFGVCSTEAIATAAAWYAVGVGSTAEGTASTITAEGAASGFCIGNSLLLNASAASNYQWKFNGAIIPGATNSTYNATATGGYTVSTTYCNKAFVSLSRWVSSVSPVVTITAPSLRNCSGSILLTANSTSGYSLQWNKNNIPVNGANSSTYNATESGNYTATISGSSTATSEVSSQGPLNIAERTCTHTISTVNVAGLPATFASSKLKLLLDITHPSNADLVIWLESPTGDKIGLTYLGYANGSNFTNTIFTDNAAGIVSQLGAPYTGTFKPLPAYYTMCNAYTTTKRTFAALGNGTINPNGAWKLHIIDAVQDNIGTLNFWKLIFPGTSSPSPNCGPVTSNQLALSISNSFTPTITSSGPTTFCQNGSVTLSASSGASYLWSTGASTSSIGVNSSGNYSVMVSDGSGCSGYASQLVTVNPLPVVSAGNYPSVLSNSGDFALIGSPLGGTFFGTGVVGGNSFSPQISGAGTFLITYNYTDQNGCSNSSQTSISVSTNCNFTVGTIAGPTNACAYIGIGGLASYTVPTTGASGYTWTIPAGSTSITGQGTNAISFKYPSNFVSGNVQVIVTSSCGMPITQSLAISKSVPAIPAAIFGPVSACSYKGTANQAIYSVTPDANALSYTWTLPANVVLISGQGTPSISVTFNAAYTSSYIYVKAVSGCGSSSSKGLYVTASLPSTPLAITGNAKACPGDVSVYSVAAVSNASSYNWLAPAGATITAGQGTTTISVSFDAGFLATGNLSVASVNGCGSSVARTKSLSRNTPASPASILGNAGGNCKISGNYSVTPVVGIAYNWTAPSGATIANGQGTNLIGVDFGPAFLSGSLSVTATNGCGTSAARTLYLTAVPSTPGVITGLATGVCWGSIQAYSIAAVPGTTNYLWTVPTGSYIQSGQGTTGITVLMGSSNGNVTVKAYDACGSSGTKSLAITSVSCARIEAGSDPESNPFSISPNPCSTCFVTGVMDETDLSITDVVGRIIPATFHKTDNGYAFNLSLEYPTGVYLIRNDKTGKAIRFVYEGN